MEKNKNVDDICIIGIRTRGAFLAQRIKDVIKEIEGKDVDHLPLTTWVLGFEPPEELKWSTNGNKIDYWYTGRQDHYHYFPYPWSVEDDFKRVDAWLNLGIDDILEVSVPNDFVGDILGHLNSRRGRVMDTGSVGSSQVIKAQVPLAEVMNYSTVLRSMTGGEGSYSMEFSHYDVVPSHLINEIVAKYKKGGEESEAG